MKKTKLINFLKSLLVVLIVVPCMLIFSACSLNFGDSAYDIAVKNGFVGTQQEWLDSLKGQNGLNGTDAPAIDLYELYSDLVEKNQFSGTYAEFVKEYLNANSEDNSLIVSDAARSIVSISTYTNKMSLYPNSKGSGVIANIDAEGNVYVITNYHVASDGNFYKCMLYSETNSYSATYVGGSKTYDLAVIKIEKGQGFENTVAKAARFNTQKAIVGTECFSVGNTEGYGIAVSRGIVSVDSEEIDMQNNGENTPSTYRVLRHDCFISHGNSGGGLFDNNGELIGITNGGVEDTLFNYALPSELVFRIYRNIMDNCVNSINQNILVYTLGVSQVLTSSTLQTDVKGNIQVVDKIKLSQIAAGGNAEQQGDLRVNDYLVSISINGNKQNIIRYYDLKEALIDIRQGDEIVIEATRAGVNGNETIFATFVAEADDFAVVQ